MFVKHLNVIPMRSTTTRLFAQLLKGEEKTTTLVDLKQSGWSLVDGRDAIFKSYKFANFVQAFDFMTDISVHAEILQHHPEWFNVYNRVDVTLSTHDVGGLSELDVELAGIMDKSYSHQSSKNLYMEQSNL